MAKLPDRSKLDALRQIVTESLRVQQQTETIDYINVGHALNDAKARQNHAIFARRGCGKTLLLHNSANSLPPETAAVYLNCEDFKRHTFPNVLIEILRSLFLELNKHLTGWFGRKRRSKQIVHDIILRLDSLQRQDDERTEGVRTKDSSGASDEFSLESAVSGGPSKMAGKGKSTSSTSAEIERTFAVYHEKLRELDHWLPELKRQLKELVNKSSNIKSIFFAN